MKRMLLLLLALVLLLAACGKTDVMEAPTQPVSFYYRTTDTDFSSENGVIRAEIRDLGTESYSDLELFTLYFKGPQSADLVAPFSQDTELTDVRRWGGTLELQLTRSANSPKEFDHSLTYACLAKTGLALDGINKVRIIVRSIGGALIDDVLLSEGDILLFDSGEAQQNAQDVTLYFANESGNLLLTETRSVPIMGQQELAQHLLELLLDEPQSGGMHTPLPPGTGILDVSVEDGVCSVDFNADFYENRPASEQAQQVTILSVVNTLCELDGIDRVQFYSQGTRLDSYGCLSLTEPWMMDTTPVGPIREELGEFAATLYLPGKSDGLLHRLTVRARARGSATREEMLLMQLFARAPQNGLAAPFFGLPTPLSVSTSRRVCTVVLENGSLPTDLTERELAIRSVAVTLTMLSEVDQVVLLEGSNVVLDDKLPLDESWFCEPPDKLS